MILMGNGCFATPQNCGMLRLEASSPTQCSMHNETLQAGYASLIKISLIKETTIIQNNVDDSCPWEMSPNFYQNLIGRRSYARKRLIVGYLILGIQNLFLKFLYVDKRAQLIRHSLHSDMAVEKARPRNL